MAYLYYTLVICGYVRLFKQLFVENNQDKGERVTQD